jgi:FAD/FMN-containing dehydrogenase
LTTGNRPRQLYVAQMNIVIETLIAAFPDNPPETEVSEKYRGDWLMRAAPDVKPLALFRPRSTEEVSRALAICSEHRVPVVPQGGLTGLTGGTVPSEGALLISMERMAAIEEVDPVSQLIVVQAGVPLERVQQAADDAGMLFPLDIGSRGTCQIGGNLSTNAGGNRVLRYGMARAMVLGLEVVLADGTILSSMNRMLKNNAGFDLKQIFIGAEGTLGIITRAVLRLAPKPCAVATAMISLPDYPRVEALLALSRQYLGDALSAFEVMWPDFYTRAAARQSGPAPLADGAGAYVIIEVSTSDESADRQLGALLEGAIESGGISDAVLAQSVQQTRSLWAIRDMGGELISAYDPVGNFDISIATAGIGAFVTDCRARIEKRWPGTETIFFGHICDGNVHLIAGGFAEDQLEPVELAVYECARDHAGSISAEHGIGLHKRDHLDLSRTAAEIATMRALKASLDPLGILNPGKVLN